MRAMVMSLFPVAIISLFWQYHLKMTMTDIMILQASFSVTVSLLEFPGGYIGDRIGYKNSLLVGASISALGWFIYCLATTFIHALIAELILGLGITFISGCDQALLYESLNREGNLNRYSLWNRYYVIAGQVGEALAALGAGWLYTTHFRLPFYGQFVIFCMVVLIIFFLKEPPRGVGLKANHGREMLAVIKQSLWDNKTLRWVILLSTMFSLSSYYPVWIVQLYTHQSGVDIEWMGFIWAAANVMVALGAGVSHHLAKWLGFNGALVTCILLATAGFFGMAVTTAAFGFVFYFLITLMRGINFTLLTEKLQSLALSHQRASLLSLRSLLVRGIYALSAPTVGVIIDQKGFHFALFGLGTFFAVTLFSLWSFVQRLELPKLSWEKNNDL